MPHNNEHESFISSLESILSSSTHQLSNVYALNQHTIHESWFYVGPLLNEWVGEEGKEWMDELGNREIISALAWDVPPCNQNISSSLIHYLEECQNVVPWSRRNYELR